jgi:putative hydrolase of the HAD superfamily
VAELKLHYIPIIQTTNIGFVVFFPLKKHGQGYSTIILSHTLSDVEKLGMPSLYLQCKQHNIDMYLKYDVEVIHRMKNKRLEKAVMVKRF